MYKVFEKDNPTKGRTFIDKGSALTFIRQSKKVKGYYPAKMVY